ncbi:phosphatidylserine decarboxylase 1 [Cylindrobasidium torrendii FP15055 ss-10]|uniref:Phosphatidylserine decarboxylase proenzyme 1, mitochondrial n=1 Tax=Cylindrobasidium torrendii FP15055 ss-10 TaxID=1314674 RepID=A0A0D7B9C7_9AGAR|nr:phosphatidylserine decarboxylase 1 [Cylindrobasidium torrendii FP15055 ss-10]
MLFSRKTILTKGRKPLYAASRVLNASSASASSAFAKCWVHGTNKTSALFRTVKNQGIRRAYSTGPDPESTGASLPLYKKLVNAWTQTPTKWFPLPLAVGALLLVAMQYRKNSARAKEVVVDEHGIEVVKLRGPWHVHVIGALPLRNMSRLWGYINSLELPVWFRPIGFRLYAGVFGCNLDEVEHDDLRTYKSLGDFFYRRLKEGVRPVDPAVLVSPADGRILHFGSIHPHERTVEQVKGVTYSLDALLGVDRPGSPPPTPVIMHPNSMPVVDEHDFANVNGIEYTLDQLMGTSATPTSEDVPHKFGDQVDASVDDQDQVDSVAVARELGVRPSLQRTPSMTPRAGNDLFFTVIYLAPGDYHRFHSPTAWVVEKRRHFVGELFSVSPWMANRLPNLFVLNERVALLGKWKHGFFSMVPVGATNVGSIMLNFDSELRTNVRGKRPPPGTFTEAVYSSASKILNGQPLTTAQEMGGFCLGSTIVLVFEAPADFEFSVEAGQKIQVGQKLGDVVKNKEE